MRRILMRRILCAIGLVLACVHGAGTQSLENEVKAAFLYNFSRFVEWPPDAFAAPQEPLTYCLMGRDPFGRALDHLVQGERARGRPLAVRRLDRSASTAGCHVLFISPLERERFAALLKSVDIDRVLTVSDTLDFLDAGGHISFFVEANRVRFAVNAETTAAARFRLSAKLLQVALVIGGEDATAK